MSKIPTEIMPKTGNPALPQAEPVGKFAAPETEKSAPAAPQKAVRKNKRAFSFLPLFAASLSGAALALLGNMALQKTDIHPPAVTAMPPAPPIFAAQAEKRVLEAQINALFAQKSRQLNDQTAEAAQILQDLADKAARQAGGQAQSDDRIQAALDAVSALSQKLAASDHSLAALKQAMAVTENRDREILFKTNALREAIAVLYDKRQEAQRGVARLLALQNLQSAFDSGAPYAAELRIFDAAFPHAPAFVPAIPEQRQEQGRKPVAGQRSTYPAIGEALAQYQQSGLPNKAVLAHDFTLLADRLAAQGLVAQEIGSFWQKLLNHAAQWASIRPQGAAAGPAPAAILARMENALAKGDYSAALAEAAKLPPQAQAAMRTYTDIIRLRLNADIFFRRIAQTVFPLDETGQSPDKTANEAVITILPDSNEAAAPYAP